MTTAAFSRYEEVMRSYVERGQRLPPGGAHGYAPDSALAITLRTASMRWMTRWPVRNLFAKQFSKADDITLPGYGRKSVTTP